MKNKTFLLLLVLLLILALQLCIASIFHIISIWYQLIPLGILAAIVVKTKRQQLPKKMMICFSLLYGLLMVCTSSYPLLVKKVTIFCCLICILILIIQSYIIKEDLYQASRDFVLGLTLCMLLTEYTDSYYFYFYLSNFVLLYLIYIYFEDITYRGIPLGCLIACVGFVMYKLFFSSLIGIM